MSVSRINDTDAENLVLLNRIRFASQTKTLAGTLTLVELSAPMQFLDPGGAGRQINLPAEAVSDGLFFIIHNTADAAEILTIKDDGGTTIATPTQNESAILYCNGVTWGSLVGASA